MPVPYRSRLICCVSTPYFPAVVHGHFAIPAPAPDMRDAACRRGRGDRHIGPLPAQNPAGNLKRNLFPPAAGKCRQIVEVILPFDKSRGSRFIRRPLTGMLELAHFKMSFAWMSSNKSDRFGPNGSKWPITVAPAISCISFTEMLAECRAGTTRNISQAPSTREERIVLLALRRSSATSTVISPVVFENQRAAVQHIGGAAGIFFRPASKPDSRSREADEKQPEASSPMVTRDLKPLLRMLARSSSFGHSCTSVSR